MYPQYAISSLSTDLTCGPVLAFHSVPDSAVAEPVEASRGRRGRRVIPGVDKIRPGQHPRTAMPRSNPGRGISEQKLPYLERGPASEGLPGPLPNPGREENGPKHPNLDIGTLTYRCFDSLSVLTELLQSCLMALTSSERSSRSIHPEYPSELISLGLQLLWIGGFQPLQILNLPLYRWIVPE